MMRLFILLLICVVPSLTYGANINPVTKDVPNVSSPVPANTELSRLDDLINATQRSVNQQKELRNLIVDYQSTQKAYLKNADDVELLYKMIKTASKAMNVIQENHLTQCFEPEFLSELNLFAQMANKRGVPKP